MRRSIAGPTQAQSVLPILRQPHGISRVCCWEADPDGETIKLNAVKLAFRYIQILDCETTSHAGVPRIWWKRSEGTVFACPSRVEERLRATRIPDCQLLWFVGEVFSDPTPARHFCRGRWFCTGGLPSCKSYFFIEMRPRTEFHRRRKCKPG